LVKKSLILFLEKQMDNNNNNGNDENRQLEFQNDAFFSFNELSTIIDDDQIILLDVLDENDGFDDDQNTMENNKE
jgi:hypothetical protein